MNKLEHFYLFNFQLSALFSGGENLHNGGLHQVMVKSVPVLIGHIQLHHFACHIHEYHTAVGLL